MWDYFTKWHSRAAIEVGYVYDKKNMLYMACVLFLLPVHDLCG